MRARKKKPSSGFNGKIAADMRTNFRIYFFLLSLLIISAAAGGFSANSLPDEAKLNYGNYLQGAVLSLDAQPRFGDVLLGFLPSIGIFVCMVASGVHLAFVLVSIGALASAGWSWGITGGVMASCYGFKGVVVAILCVYLAQLIPTVCYFKVFVIGVRRAATKKPKPPLSTLRASFIGWGILLILSRLAGQMVFPALARALL